MAPPGPETILRERPARMTNAKDADDLDELRVRSARLEQENQELRKALAEKQALAGVLVACANCKKMRDESEEWIPLEAYLGARFNVEVSHSLCPTCAPDFGLRDS